MRAQTFVLALLAGSMIAGPSAALDPSGTTVGVDPDAQAGGATGIRILEIKGPIYMGDVITTDVKGLVQIEFVDETKFVVGANSKVTIDAFVFDANKTAQQVSISAVKGAFRFITGKSPKGNYAIRTPTMTIGVRGTAFDLSVRSGTGESTMVVHEGATDICDILHRCQEAQSGNMVVGTREGIKSVPSGRERSQRLNAFFPLVKSQRNLGVDFQVQVPATVQPNNDPTATPRGNDDGDTPPAGSPPPSDPPDGRPPRR